MCILHQVMSLLILMGVKEFFIGSNGHGYATVCRSDEICIFL